jgi:uncharacterized protein
MGKRSSASLGAMRTSFRLLLPMCLCGALLAACASATTEDIRAAFEAGLKDYDAGDYRSAYNKWKSIEDVDLAAMRNVALMLRTGKGVEKNPKAALRMMELAAQAGLVTAQADLADMLLKGEAGPPDVKEAIFWLGLAAAAGHPVAAFQLGQLYEQGTGVKKNIETARKLYKAAAQAGMAEADARLQALPPEPPQTAAAPQIPPSPSPPPPGPPAASPPAAGPSPTLRH